MPTRGLPHWSAGRDRERSASRNLETDGVATHACFRIARVSILSRNQLLVILGSRGNAEIRISTPLHKKVKVLVPPLPFSAWTRRRTNQSRCVVWKHPYRQGRHTDHTESARHTRFDRFSDFNFRAPPRAAGTVCPGWSEPTRKRMGSCVILVSLSLSDLLP